MQLIRAQTSLREPVAHFKRFLLPRWQMITSQAVWDETQANWFDISLFCCLPLIQTSFFSLYFFFSFVWLRLALIFHWLQSVMSRSCSFGKHKENLFPIWDTTKENSARLLLQVCLMYLVFFQQSAPLSYFRPFQLKICASAILQSLSSRLLSSSRCVTECTWKNRLWTLESWEVFSQLIFLFYLTFILCIFSQCIFILLSVIAEKVRLG